MSKLISLAIVGLVTATCVPAFAIGQLTPQSKRELARAEHTCDTRLIQEWMHRYSNRINDCEDAFWSNHPAEYKAMTGEDFVQHKDGNSVNWGGIEFTAHPRHLPPQE